MSDKFSNLCTPAKVYFVFTLLTVLMMLFQRVKLVAVFYKIFFAGLWTFFLSWLCKKGYKTVSWFLVLLPFILMFIAWFSVIVGIMDMTSTPSGDLKVVAVTKCGQRN